MLYAHQSELLAEPRAKAVNGLLLLTDHYGIEMTHTLVLYSVGNQPEQAQMWLLSLAGQVRGDGRPLPALFSLDRYLKLSQVVAMGALLAHVEPLVPPVEGLRGDDAKLARIMLERLQELHLDTQEIQKRRGAPTDGPTKA